MGIVGARGKIAHSVTYKDKQGELQTFAGAYSRKGVRGECNILCVLPEYVNNPTAKQIAVRNKFRQAAQQTNIIMNDVEQLAPYREAWIALPNHGTAKAQYPTLRGYVLAQVFKSL